MRAFPDSDRAIAFPVDGINIMPSAEDRRLIRVTKICLALPEASRELTGDHAAFKVRKKIFGYFLNSHHGDEIVSVCVKLPPGDNSRLAALDPRCYLPAYIGSKGWMGLRLDVGKVDWEEVADFVGGSYRLVAPRRLVTLITAPSPETGRE